MADKRPKKRARRTDSDESRQVDVSIREGPIGPVVYLHDRWRPIGEGVAIAACWGRWDLLKTLEPVALEYVRSQATGDAIARRFEIHLTVLAMVIGHMSFEKFPQGQVRPVKILDLYPVEGQSQDWAKRTVAITYQHRNESAKMETFHIHNLRAESGVSLHLEPFASAVPHDWLINWHHIRDQQVKLTYWPVSQDGRQCGSSADEFLGGVPMTRS